ncbi:MAG TPA: homoserine dehydrogenase [Rhodospirillaceae bacterium]|nr:homoserine dehydrogenase [Rhodospirillaceae bacterium]MAX61161.1 homoserine dehydrogenase [Rhodospirillaceae bacterium]MBB55904.1 homoserine dehydrogenase [Rhodospirillaceae bacterium]HAE00364.1 homoserine dehydrogenase [Rhodospirillaceae bacterium]|tara:strand:- start:42028 stop:43317 length:1290 start_codon:yes stop_codon:yes gene_type:complete
MAETLKVAVAGLGTVGAGVVSLLARQAGLIAQRSGRPILVTAVSARDRDRKRDCDIGSIAWFDDAVTMASQADCDVVVELIGGSEGTAKAVCEAALKAGRHVVTANKALIAIHGTELAKLAEEHGSALNFEAAVAGGIPIIKALREGLAGNQIESVQGILNGTCNYILSTMRDTGRAYEEVLQEAQELGYAESDPTFDVEGIDAAHKLAILATLAFGRAVDFDGVYIEGISRIAAVDIDFAEELGFRVKLLGMASADSEGVMQRVHPVLVPANAPIARVEGVFNAVVTQADPVGTTVLEGRGAGAGPTASAVISDIMDIAAGRFGPTFGVPVANLLPSASHPIERREGAYYVRLRVIDKPGVIAGVTAALRDEHVSMESIIQRGRDPNEPVDVVLTLHETTEAAMKRALGRIEELSAVIEPPHVIRIER